MFYQLLATVDLAQTPSMDALSAGDVEEGEIGSLLQDPGNEWIEMRFLTPGMMPVSGWLRKKDDQGNDRIKEVEAPPVPEFSLWAFVKGCIDVEYWINAHPPEGLPSVFVAGDYLLAWANIETGNNIRWIHENSAPTDGTGPFQLSTREWDAFLADPLGQGYTADNRFVALDQISGAAFAARKAIIDLAAAIDQHDAVSGHDDGNEKIEPYIPAYVDVLLAHFFGVEFAVACRIAKFNGKAGTPVADLLLQSWSEAEVAEFAEDRKKILLDWKTGEAVSIDGMYQNVEAVLDKAFVTAFEQIKELTPEDAAIQYRDGQAPWFETAKVQETDWKQTLQDEETPQGRARVVQYFQRINYSPINPQGPVPHWCGAFAGFCVLEATQAGLGFDGPARAANWVNFGNVSIPIGDPEPPKGAVVVLSPDKGSSTSGHVGFFDRYSGANEATVFLLGGNQQDKVQLSKFARSKIRAIRWHSQQKSADDSDSSAVIAGAAGQFAPLLDFIAFYECNGNYNGYFGHANSSDPVLVTKTIAEIQSFQDNLRKQNGKSSATGRYQFMFNTVAGLIKNGVIRRTDIFNTQTQDRMAIALLKGAGLGRYLAGRMSDVDFGVRVAAIWAAMPVPRTVHLKGRTVHPGQSYYAGDGLNKALASVDRFMEAIRSIRS